MFYPSKNSDSDRSALSRNVIRLGWVSFFADVSSEMLYPILPIFLTTVIGAPVSILGVVEGAAEAVASLLKVISGNLSDRFAKRKPFILIGYLISAFAKPFIGLATGWPMVLGGRSLDRLGKGLRTGPRDALLADSVSAEHRGKAFGLHRGMDTLGAILGPLLALGLLSVFHENLRWIFGIAFVPALLGALLVLTAVEIPRPPSVQSVGIKKQDFKNALSASPQFRTYLVGWGFFAVVNSSDMFLLLKAKELGFTITSTVLVYCFYNLVYAAMSPLLGKWSDRIGRKRIIVGGLLVFACVYAGLALAEHAWQLWTLFGIYGFYIAATDGVGKAMVVDLVAQNRRAGSLGLFGTVSGIGTLIASSLGGLLWTHIGSWATFSVGAIGALLGASMIGLGISRGVKPNR